MHLKLLGSHQSTPKKLELSRKIKKRADSGSDPLSTTTGQVPDPVAARLGATRRPVGLDQISSDFALEAGGIPPKQLEILTKNTKFARVRIRIPSGQPVTRLPTRWR